MKLELNFEQTLYYSDFQGTFKKAKHSQVILRSFKVVKVFSRYKPTLRGFLSLDHMKLRNHLNEPVSYKKRADYGQFKFKNF